MVADTERSYTGTNFVVITLVVLLVAVASYLIIAQGSNMADDTITDVQKQETLR